MRKKWHYFLTEKARKNLSKEDKQIQRRILNYLDRLIENPNPRDLGEALTGRLKEYWKYRTGDYRMICKIEDNILTIMVLKVGHRREIYSDFLQ